MRLALILLALSFTSLSHAENACTETGRLSGSWSGRSEFDVVAFNSAKYNSDHRLSSEEYRNIQSKLQVESYTAAYEDFKNGRALPKAPSCQSSCEAANPGFSCACLIPAVKAGAVRIYWFKPRLEESEFRGFYTYVMQATVEGTYESKQSCTVSKKIRLPSPPRQELGQLYQP